MASDELPPGFRPDDPTARDNADSDYAPCGFKITEHPTSPGESTSTPWILVEIDEPGLRVLKFGDAFLGLHFRAETSLEEAKRLAHDMDRMIVGISCTKFVT